MTAEEIIDSSVPYVTTKYTLSRVLSFMDTFKISHMPVVEGDKYIGLVSEDEIYDRDSFEEPVSGMGVLPAPHVLSSQHIFDALAVAVRFNIPVVPVIDTDHKYLGSISLQTLMSSMAKITNVEAKGAVLILEVGVHDYSLSEIARIVESENGRILASYVTEYEDSTKIDVTIVLNQTEISPVVKSLERYGYKVNAFFSGVNMMDDFYRDRYDLLMNYMKI
ncbi:MAG: CBS domain-containing protein [Bacteroidales bacterium]|nr:CBS domain-containing protein [Bacteroidales bacterium]